MNILTKILTFSLILRLSGLSNQSLSMENDLDNQIKTECSVQSKPSLFYKQKNPLKKIETLISPRKPGVLEIVDYAKNDFINLDLFTIGRIVYDIFYSNRPNPTQQTYNEIVLMSQNVNTNDIALDKYPQILNDLNKKISLFESFEKDPVHPTYKRWFIPQGLVTKMALEPIYATLYMLSFAKENFCRKFKNELVLKSPSFDPRISSETRQISKDLKPIPSSSSPKETFVNGM